MQVRPTRSRSRYESAFGEDAGVSLVELLVALLVLLIVMSAALVVFLNTIRTSKTLDERAFAIQLANQHMDQIRAAGVEPLPTCPGTSVPSPSRLVAGRTTSDVNATWNGWQGDLVRTQLDATVPLSMTDLTDCAPDPGTGEFPVPVVYSPPVVESDVTFTSYSFVGECFAPDASATNADCLSSRATPNVPLYRVIVLVTWEKGSSSCEAGCNYTATTLIDPNAGDPVFGPTAIPDGPADPADPADPFVTYSNEPIQIGVNQLIANDDFTRTFRYAGIEVQPVPGEGEASLKTLNECGYAPTADRTLGCVEFLNEINRTGPLTFQYRLKGLTGDVSNWTTVTVQVLTPPGPVAVDDGPNQQLAGSTQTYDVLANDSYWPLNVFASWPWPNPSGGIASVTIGTATAGTATVDPATWAITYEGPTGYSGQVAIPYQITDSWQQSADATLVVDVIGAGPCTLNSTSASANVNQPVETQVLAPGLYSCPSGVTISAATLQITDVSPTTATATTSSPGVIRFSATAAGSYTVSYTAQDSLGRWAAATLNVSVSSPIFLVANDDGSSENPFARVTVSLGQNYNTVVLPVLENDVCPGACRIYVDSITGGSYRWKTTGSNQYRSEQGWAVVEGSGFRFRAGGSTGRYAIQYHLELTVNGVVYTSNQATVWVRVRS